MLDHDTRHKDGKVNRNAPCPCGSGKKYKKCCLLIEEAQKQKEIQEWHEWFEKDCEEGAKNLKEYQEWMKEKGIAV